MLSLVGACVDRGFGDPNEAVERVGFDLGHGYGILDRKLVGLGEAQRCEVHRSKQRS